MRPICTTPEACILLCRIDDARTRESLRALALELIGHTDIGDNLTDARDMILEFAVLAGMM